LRGSEFYGKLDLGNSAGNISRLDRGTNLEGWHFGLVGNLIVGVVGSVLGSFSASMIGLAATGLLGELIVAVAGAILFLWLVNYFGKKK
jgi:uncharacterized membrane protein YeaQ/YmgE (transglycosylase-associated protein family)